MDSKDLKAFLAVYEYRNITKAAKSLYMTSQGLSQLIKKLEKELEVELFFRSTVGVNPSPYGEGFYEKAKDLLKELENIKCIVKGKGTERKKVLTVASTYGVLAYLTVEFILDFQHKYPDIELDIQEFPDNIVEEDVWLDRVDVGFLAGPIDVIKFDAELFTSHKHCLVINKEHPLAEREFIDYIDLINQPIALIGRSFRPYYNNLNRFLKKGLKPNILMETSEIEMTHQVAHLNKGIGLSVDFCAFSNPYINTVIRPFKEYEECTWDTYIVFKKGKVAKREAEIFRDFSIDWLDRNKQRLFNWRLGKDLLNNIK